MWRIHTVEEVEIQDTILISMVMDWDGDYPMKR
jgi:hypothetical protein